MAFETRIPLRWGDMDTYGHCNNAAFIVYMEQARVNAFHSRPDDRAGIELLDGGVVVVEHTIRYYRQLPYSDVPLRIRLWTENLRNASYQTVYELWNDNSDVPELCATACTTLAPINFETNRPRRLSPEEKEFLSQFVSPEHVD